MRWVNSSVYYMLLCATKDPNGKSPCVKIGVQRCEHDVETYIQRAPIRTKSWGRDVKSDNTGVPFPHHPLHIMPSFYYPNVYALKILLLSQGWGEGDSSCL